MRNCLIILLCLITSVASAQKIRITSRKSGAEITVFPQKVKAVVNKDGEFFEGRVRPLPEYLMIGDHSVPYSQIGFLEVKNSTAGPLSANHLNGLEEHWVSLVLQ